ncbi:MAG: septal ring lytic transglycosylase RlpA family protein [Candidatus Electrothrix sp. YB6]
MMRGSGINSDKVHWRKTASALLLCLLPITNGCSLKNVATDKDAAVGAEEKMEKMQAFQSEDRDDAAGKEETAADVSEQDRQGRELTVIMPNKTKKRKKHPATQRPYVIEGHTYYPIPSADGYREKGFASWYGPPFHGRKTANGEIYNMYSRTAAHKTLPMGTMLLVKNLKNGKSSVVRINDRGPFISGRIIDLSYSTALELGIVNNGTEHVQIVALGEELENEKKLNTQLAALSEEKKDAAQKQKKQENEKNKKDGQKEYHVLKPTLRKQKRDNSKIQLALLDEDLEKQEKEESGQKEDHILKPTLKKHKEKEENPKIQIAALARENKRQSAGEKEKTVPEISGQSKKLLHQDFDKGTFYVQTRTFEQRQEARKLARFFADRGRDVIIQQFPAAGTNFFRVMVFSSTSLRQAEQDRDSLRQMGFRGAFVINRDEQPKGKKRQKLGEEIAVR